MSKSRTVRVDSDFWEWLKKQSEKNQIDSVSLSRMLGIKLKNMEIKIE